MVWRGVDQVRVGMMWRGAYQVGVGDDVERGRSSKGRGRCGEGHIK